MQAQLVLGNQLFRDVSSLDKSKPTIMIESDSICRKYFYHKHKLVLVLSAMRSYKDYLQANGFELLYVEYKKSSVFTNILADIIKTKEITHLTTYQPADRSALNSLKSLSDDFNFYITFQDNPMFYNQINDFKQWYDNQKSPLLENFYRQQRKQRNILISDGKPTGGQWNFDKQNRKPLPKKDINIPKLPKLQITKHTQAVSKIINRYFSGNPGSTDDFWLPTTNQRVDEWVEDFFKQRFTNFGTYEDAMQNNQPFLFHSVLSPLLNLGLLTPAQIVQRAVDAYTNNNAPINSVEGFVRQILGWREYMNGMYWQHPDMQEANYFEFTKPLEDWWYNSNYKQQNLPLPVMSALNTVHTYGYNHHIERLMVLGNWFLLNQYSPQSVFEWFSAMYVDAYDWVMVGNVIGMSQYADGGIIATKPYISGGNYLQKMGRWWSSDKKAKDSEFTKLYWQFLNNNRHKLKNNQRMSLMLNQAKKHQ